MLVTRLNNKSLSQIISDSNVDHLGVHDSLCACAQELLDKYKLKQIKQGHSEKLGIKTRAAGILLRELSKVPKDADEARKAISFALKRHVEALQGHEHLLSKKGNTYALIEQTRCLRKEYDIPAPLLRYHDLKEELLGPDSPLSDEQKDVISALTEKKCLSLRALEAIEARPVTAKALVTLHKAGMLELGLWVKEAEHKKADLASGRLVKPHQESLPELDLYALMLEHQYPLCAASAMMTLYQEDLLEPEFCIKVLKHKNPVAAAAALVRLKKMNLHRTSAFDDVLEHENPLIAVYALEILLKAEFAAELGRPGLFVRKICVAVLKSKNPVISADALVQLVRHELDTETSRFAIIAHKHPDKAVAGMIYLSKKYFFHKNSRDQILAAEDPFKAAMKLGESAHFYKWIHPVKEKEKVS